MRGQFFILAVAILISILIFTMPHYRSYTYAKRLSENFENEIIYIQHNFNYSYINDFVNKFENYANSLGYSFSYVCISNVNLGIKECDGNNDRNCCIYFNRTQVISVQNVWICNQKITLIPVKDWVCFCYVIEGNNEKIVNFFCT